MHQQDSRRFQKDENSATGFQQQGWQRLNPNWFQQPGWQGNMGYGAQMDAGHVPNPFEQAITERMQVITAFNAIYAFIDYMDTLNKNSASNWFSYGIPAPSSTMVSYGIGFTEDYKTQVAKALKQIDVTTLPTGLQEVYRYVENAVKDHATEE